MEIISLKHVKKVVYDRFSLGFSASDENLILIDQYHQTNRFSVTLQEYELSKELIIWLSSDLFSELQFDDVWLIFTRLQKAQVEKVFSALKSDLPLLFQKTTQPQFRQNFYSLLDELMADTNSKRTFALAA